MNRIQVNIYPDHTVYAGRTRKFIKIHLHLLWIYLDNSFYLKTYQEEYFAAQNFINFLFGVSLNPNQLYSVASSHHALHQNPVED